jgi:hypothetical protein
MMADSTDLLCCSKMVGDSEALLLTQVGGDRCSKMRHWCRDCSV